MVDPVPFPHLIVDDFASREELAAVNGCWPLVTWPGWVRYQGERGDKLASNLSRPLPVPCSLLLARIAAFVLGEWPGLPPVVPDLGLYGAGLNEMFSGGSLPVHLDATRHARLGLERVLSAVLWVHQDWRDGWGGRLQLWEGDKPYKGIFPEPGRLCVFDCRQGKHSVEQVECPRDRSRRALGLFFYAPREGTKERPRAVFD